MHLYQVARYQRSGLWSWRWSLISSISNFWKPCSLIQGVLNWRFSVEGYLVNRRADCLKLWMTCNPLHFLRVVRHYFSWGPDGITCSNAVCLCVRVRGNCILYREDGLEVLEHLRRVRLEELRGKAASVLHNSFSACQHLYSVWVGANIGVGFSSRVHDTVPTSYAILCYMTKVEVAWRQATLCLILWKHVVVFRIYLAR